MKAPEAITRWKARSCWDAEGSYVFDWEDPVERAAVALYAMSFNGPEDVGSSVLDSQMGREKLLKGWSVTNDHMRKERHLYRRRALVLIGVFVRKPAGS